ncbi:unnamed protein product [Calicophoron daubneyi]|uniref:Peptidase M14 domain-containing protein n=1 Tax=Calicophoron daubneyi TaxID=300641 RepID=A0AAV2TFX6_CALDB
MTIKRLLTAIALLCMISHMVEALYEGYKVLRIRVNNEEAARALLLLEEQTPGHYDIWNMPRKLHQPVYMSSSPAGFLNLTIFLVQHNVSYNLVNTDLSREIAREKYRNEKGRLLRYARGVWRSVPDAYKRYDEILDYLDRQTNLHSFMKVETIGYTAESRPIKGVLISMDSSKPMVWIDAGIHAREWIAPASAIYLIDRLLTRNGQMLLKDHQFYIVPVVNPDGYEYTHTTDRYWRKNRAVTLGEPCVGTDLNRNFPLKWGCIGASPRACSDTYRGPEPASELETQSIMKKLSQFREKIVLSLNLHSFGQYILTPYGFAKYRYPPNYKNMIHLGQMAKRLIHERHGFVYQVGSSSDLLYEAAGGSDDYLAGTMNVPYSYTIELSDEGRYGFLLPAIYIRPVGKHLWTAIKVFLQHM